MRPRSTIRIEGAREHNLKNVSLEIPRDRLVVITGPSGSGKSSLAFDTLFAEGQRKYVESLSAYARQFLDQLKKPDVDSIEGLSPAIAIEQRSSSANPRSTIATTTEIYDFLRLLFAHVGTAHCPESGEPMLLESATDITDSIMSWPEKTRLILLAPLIDGEKGEFRDVFEKLTREGFVRARVDGDFVDLTADDRVRLDGTKKHTIEAVVDRLVVDDKARSRIADSVETALHWGSGRLLTLHQFRDAEDREVWVESIRSNQLMSPKTGKVYERVTPKHFSFNSPLGACEACHGLGQTMIFDADLVIPDEELTLAGGAIAPWRKVGKRMINHYQSVLSALCEHFGGSMEEPFKRLPERLREVILNGSQGEKIVFPQVRGGEAKNHEKPFEGVLALLTRLFEETESEATRSRLKGFMQMQTCQSCEGRRLQSQILAVTVSGEEAPLSIMDICSLSINRAAAFFDRFEVGGAKAAIASEVVREVRKRLNFMRNVGLGYLTLDRESGTLSGGEAQRIRLATQIGAGLVGVIYILDEPSIGLHQRDNDRLLATLKGLRDAGNSVVVVEHDEETIRSADYLVDIGPGAGSRGGEIVAQGTVEEVLHHGRSLTGKYLRGDYTLEQPSRLGFPKGEKGWLTIHEATENNLQSVTARIPVGAITCVTGVSGSGKSTLIDDVLRKALFRRWFGSKERPGSHRDIDGIEFFGKVILVDQSPIGRTPRSNPATYTGMFSHIRELFSKLPAARVRGFGAGRFSFNVKGGRCEKCQGDGLLRIEMQFLPPVYVTCESCQGRRYNRETLEIAYKGRNIADVLDMTVDEAVRFFRAVPKVCDPCLRLAEVGLGYLTLGQAATTLSGGEAQRVKLAAELNRKSTGNTLYLMDEPTTGLHFHDVAKLLEVIFKLRDGGNTLVIIEHNLDVIKTADWILDLGPEGGSGGGRLVIEGTPEQVAGCDASHTGRYLKKALSRV